MAFLFCPQCKGKSSLVIDSRGNGDTIRRRRSCYTCLFRWSTYEVSLVKTNRFPKPKLERIIAYELSYGQKKEVLHNE